MNPRAAFVALAAVALTALLARGLGLSASPEAVALVAATALSLGWGITGAAWILRIVSRNGLPPAVATVLGAAVVGIAVVAARAHFELFGVPLDAETLDFAWDGLTAREVVLPLGEVAGWGAVAAVCVGVAAWWLHRLAPGPGPSIAGRAAVLAAASGVFVLSEPHLFLPHSEPTTALREVLPWQEPDTRARRNLEALALRDDSGSIVRQSRSEVDASFERLRSARDVALASAARPQDEPNLLFIVMESFRDDLIDADTTPFLDALHRRCASPEYHYASGANTESGLFGLLHGLSMHHYWHFKESFDQPAPLELLGRWGYRRSLYRTFDLDFRDLGERFLSREFDHDRAAAADGPVGRDREIIDALIADLEAAASARSAPRFDLVVTYATHWGYHYPAEFQHHEPVAPDDLRVRNATSDHALREYAEGLHNRQRNAAAYTDSLVARVFDALERTGRLADTLVVVTGDHGEAFFEHGRLGHTWSLENEMVRVPLFVCTPDSRDTEYRFSDHADVFPTLFDWMRAPAEVRSVTSGKSLFAFQAERDFALTAVPRRRAAMRMAVIGHPFKVAFLPFGPLRPLSVTDLEDRPVTSPRAEAVAALLRAADGARSRH